MSAVKEGLEKSTAEHRDAFEVVRNKCPDLVRLTKEAYTRLMAKDMLGYQTTSRELSALINDTQRLISRANKREADESFNLMEAADMVRFC